MTTLRRLLRALLDSLPLHSTRAVARAWGAGFFDGVATARRDIGVRRDTHGRFTKISP